jgi:hypothetical protein
MKSSPNLAKTDPRNSGRDPQADNTSALTMELYRRTQTTAVRGCSRDTPAVVYRSHSHTSQAVLFLGLLERTPSRAHCANMYLPSD